MSEIGTETPSKAEYCLKIRLSAHLSQFLELRKLATPGGDHLFHVSNSHVKVDPKFVTDNQERALAARFATDVEDGQERIVAREAVIDLGGGDLAHFHVIGFFNAYRNAERVTRNCLRDIAQQFQNWLKNRCEKWGAPQR